MDLEKALDNIDTIILLDILKSFGVNDNYI